MRHRWGKSLLIIASGGVHEPQQALDLRAAGADLVQVDSGLVYTGPGLPKRINDAFLCQVGRSVSPSAVPARLPEMTWFWTTLMGGGMLFGSLLALVIAATRIVLPYDEAFVGTTRAGLSALNPWLLAFMAHDRVTLAGTMVAIGVMYVGLSVFGIRHGLHWARQAVFISAFTGFASFFLFLGFGYLDTFHAFVTGAMLQLLLLGVHARLASYTPVARPDPARRLGVAMESMGAIAADHPWICSAHGRHSDFGDRHYAGVRARRFGIHADNSRGVGFGQPAVSTLIAHDRATFGGMLLASGWVFLLPTLWGFRRGSAWLWWTFLIAGLAAYAAAIGVHFSVGYMSRLGAFVSGIRRLALFLLGLILSYSLSEGLTIVRCIAEKEPLLTNLRMTEKEVN
ncbi:MAG: hypothetical protein ACR2G5_11235 [Pyrinomonadaceae bacterium]